MSNDAKGILEFSEEVGNLKHVDRRGWFLKDIPNCEQVTGHMYRMAMLALFALDPIPGCDMNKTAKLCLVHDLAECRVGDITPYDNVPVDEKHRMESEAMKALSAMLKPKQESHLRSIYEEYEAKETIEAKLAKDLDIFDMVHQAFEYEKKEFKRASVLPDLEEFFDAVSVLSKIKNDQVQGWVRELLIQRKTFLETIKSDNKSLNGSV